MNLLIVDDEWMAIQGIEMVLDWQQIGIKQIFSAESIMQAKAAMKEEKIKIVICDVEMRHENGLEFVKWVKDNYQFVKCIILTGHANFNYLKTSMQLNVVDYILKPVQAGLINKAVSTAMSQFKCEQNSIQEKEINNAELLKLFLRQLMNGVIAPEIECVETNRAIRGLNINIHEKGNLYFFRIRKWNEEWDEEYFQKGMSNMVRYLDKLFSEKNINFFYKVNEQSFSMFSLRKNEDMVIIQQFLDYVKYYYCSEMCCYWKSEVEIWEIGTYLDILQEMDSNNFIENNAILGYQSCIKRKKMGREPDMKIWLMLLESENILRLHQEIDTYILSDFLKREITGDLMNRIYQDFVGLIIIYMNGKSYDYKEILCRKEYIVKSKIATVSLPYLAEWMHLCINLMTETLLEKEKNYTEIDMIIQYISEHLDEELSRKQLADLVYLSIDHMARKFKINTGKTLTDYIFEERMKRACELLTYTDYSIAEVATRVGYVNMAHFSRSFKKTANITPSEYRMEKRNRAKGMTEME